jgi:hypothetical protein
MRAGLTAFLGAFALAGVALLVPARAEDTKACEVPSDMLGTESVLDKVAGQVKSSRQLDVVVVGSGSSTLAGADGATSAYPARLEFYLGQKLPGVTVHVTTDLHLKQSAEEVAPGIGKLVKDGKPALVVWQTGTVDALRSVEAEDFRTAISDGITDLKTAGANVILVNPQYNPRMDTVISVTSYLDNMRVVAQERDVGLFDRFAIMRQWNDNGDFDLSVTTHSLALARSVHDCIGRALADFIVEASRINLEDLRKQK